MRRKSDQRQGCCSLAEHETPHCTASPELQEVAAAGVFKDRGAWRTQAFDAVGKCLTKIFFKQAEAREWATGVVAATLDAYTPELTGRAQNALPRMPVAYSGEARRLDKCALLSDQGTRCARSRNRKNRQADPRKPIATGPRSGQCNPQGEGALPAYLVRMRARTHSSPSRTAP